jgi:RimJ/RimL family protein N-acetyltransferase
MRPWTVTLRRDVNDCSAGDVVGWSSLLDISEPNGRLEVGSTAYTPVVWGSVVNAEVKLLLLGHAFGELGVGRVQLKTDTRNERSQRAIERLGAQREGVLRRFQRRSDGTMRDTVVYSILAAEWPGVREELQRRVDAAVTPLG